MGEERSSPMLDQYRKIKRDHQGNVLFFRLGDFYEMFAEDAVEISALLNLTLTSRNGLPMCGIPYHAARSYIARLLKYGKKVAICEQLSEPGKGQKIIDRQVIEVITPGTTVDEDYLDRGSSNYLAALAVSGSSFISFAYIDLSAGGFYAASFPLAHSAERISLELERLQAREILVQESLLKENANIGNAIARVLSGRSALVINRWADWLFDREKAQKRLQRQFGLSSLKSFGLEDNSPELLAAGAILDYLDDTSKSLIPHIRSITVYQDNEFVGIDESSQRNLELVRNLHDGDVRFSLLEVIDETRCAMGKRLLKWRLLHPLRDINRIQARLNMVETLYRDQGSLNTLRELLGRTPDLERLSARLAMDRAHGKDMLSIKNALVSCEVLKQLRDALTITCESDASPGAMSANIRNLNHGVAQSLHGVTQRNTEESKTPCSSVSSVVKLAIPDTDEDFTRLMELKNLLERSICDDPSILLTEGNLIRDGYNTELDNLRKLRDSGRQLLEAYLEEERLATGISSLKIRYNRLIGYFFEVTKVHLNKIPEHFIRRQGVAGGERFSTERLAGLESDINGASDKIVELERRLFLELREKAKLVLGELAAEARRIAELDAAQSLARSASLRGWVRPAVDTTNALEIYEGRHPVVESHLGRGEFIPNDIILNNQSGSPFFAMITGPNMAGKSTYLRSAALITLMAQMGSFIPAREGRIGLCDRIYCRVGASDNLARGESTFLVEMNETSYILNTASEKSLVIMDEVGRGTGTNDGLSIAWAVSEELLEHIKCRTFFATHYHELSLLQHPRMVNRSMEVLEKDGGIVFLRRLKEGPTAESYGLHVARLAGLPETVLERARHIMERLRQRDAGLGEALPSSNESDVVNHVKKLVNQKVTDTVLQEMSLLEPEKMTPLEALGLLNEWKRRFAEEKAPVNLKPRGKTVDSSPSLFD
ncbi:MAG: DNA mismatch repair protein MutS [Treponema sp.]|jgi:DNA mismatch repair protein MutS|nr:DNA mismatch repair protein MutS [Treponema sp.]